MVKSLQTSLARSARRVEWQHSNPRRFCDICCTQVPPTPSLQAYTIHFTFSTTRKTVISLISETRENETQKDYISGSRSY